MPVEQFAVHLPLPEVRELAFDEEVRDFHEVAVRHQVFDVISAITEDPFFPVDITDRRKAASGVDKTGIIGDVAGFAP